MSKLVKIIVSIVGLTLFYIWMSSMFQSCQSKSSNKGNEIDTLSDSGQNGEEIIDVSDEDFFEDGSDQSQNNISNAEFTELEQNLTEDANTSPATSPKIPEKPKTAKIQSGRYLVISGNYLVESNANEMVKKLNNLGYGNAEIVIFERSPYHTVIASRYNSQSDAFQAASSLKQKGVDCYVKTK